jgi:hypothetical protein
MGFRERCIKCKCEIVYRPIKLYIYLEKLTVVYPQLVKKPLSFMKPAVSLQTSVGFVSAPVTPSD